MENFKKGKNVEKVCISQTIKKLGKIPNVSQPKGITCRKNAPCASCCYAGKGRFNYNSAKLAYQRNYCIYQHEPERYFDEIQSFLDNTVISYKFFRWHPSGDIVDMDYLDGMVRVARNCKHTKFLTFTKKFELVNQYVAEHGGSPEIAFPRNFRMVFSMWDTNFIVDNPYGFPTSWIKFEKKSSLKKFKTPEIPNKAKPCKGNCEKCLYCWKMKSGQSVWFHEHD